MPTTDLENIVASIRPELAPETCRRIVFAVLQEATEVISAGDTTLSLRIKPALAAWLLEDGVAP